jgi:hypothetical protein
MTGQVVAAGSQVETIDALSGGSQQCSPAVQWTAFPPSVVALNGQYTPTPPSSAKSSPGAL